MNKYNIAAFFSGVGGIELGFEQTNKFQTIYANEFDKNAGITYQTNHPHTPFDSRDIHDISPEELPDNVDLVVGGFPCQAFSIAGYRKGFEDERGDLFFELLRIIKYKKPQAIFIENVKNMVTHDNGNTFKVIREALTINGYYIKWKVLNGKDYGNVPQNRERIYIVGFLSQTAFNQFQFPNEIPLKTTLRDVIDFTNPVDEYYYYTNEKHPFYHQLKENITSSQTIYQWRRQYVRENKAGVVPTLTANMGTGGHNVPLILTDDYRIRKLTPKETFNVQGFPSTFKLPSAVANGQLYKQAGNSVVVPLIKRIAENISTALKGNAIEGNNTLAITHQNKIAIILVKMKGQFEGSSFVQDYANSIEEARSKIAHYLHPLTIIDDTDYKKVLRSNKDIKFYSIHEL